MNAIPGGLSALTSESQNHTLGMFPGPICKGERRVTFNKLESNRETYSLNLSRKT